MSYCRFENTVKDLEECIDALNDADWDIEEMVENASSKYEARAIRRFVSLCKEVAEAFDDGED